MTITIINDCRDENAKGRQCARISSLLNCPVSFVGVENDIGAAGNIIDTLDALEEREGVVLVNVAPRDGKAKKWPNGTPFGYFRYKNTLVVTTIDGYVLSLVKKYGLIDTINVFDAPSVLADLRKHGDISEGAESYVADSQFRSFDYSPYIARLLLGNTRNLPVDEYSVVDIPDIPNVIWWVDNFGNCKTTFTSEDDREEVVASVGRVIKEEPTFYDRLKDVPTGDVGLIVGSSGLGKRRFIEIVVQDVLGGSASARYKLTQGQSFDVSQV